MGSQQTQGFSFLVKISDEDFTQKLIQPGFLKLFNGVVPDEIILRTSSYGGCWLIKLKRAEENLFFQQGWSDFVEYHSLEVGDSLILEYIGNSQFYAKIYGKNCCEKESPLSEIPSNLGKKKKNVSATEMASQLKFKHPFFAITLQPSYTNYLHIPTTFERHLPENLLGCMIRLEVSDGGTWPVKCLPPSPGRNGVRLCKGVPKFLKDNNLVEGDACIFEAIKNNSDFVFKVHIFRNPRL